MIVQKYGGSSVGSPEKIKKVAARIAKISTSGVPIVVVISAMGDTTDELVHLARQVTPQNYSREMDMLLSAGERISMALLSMALRDHGQAAISFTGSQAGIITDESHTRARILEIRPTRVLEELACGRIVIVAGFQGVSRTKEVTTLGRGGSDTTAVALAAALKADRCEVLTDVPGIFSADPRIVERARRYQVLSLGLVHEMAVKGAQVMHPRSVEIARQRKFPIYVGLAHAGENLSEEGTMLIPEVGLESPTIVAVVAKVGLHVLRFEAERTERFQEIFEELGNQGILTHGIEFSSRVGLTVLLDPTESMGFLDKHASAVSAEGVVAVSVIGYQMQQNAILPARILGTLARLGIQPGGLTCHSQSITVWFSDTDPSRVVKALHAELISEAKGN